MPLLNANGIEIFYDEIGAADDTPLLLICGIGNQMIRWDVRFCQQLAARGHRVIRFDNRDVGLSSKIEDRGGSSIGDAFRAISARQPIDAAYTLSDMAADAIGVLDALGIEKAHVVGMSMGGAIAQTMAIEHPTRLRTLTAVMATSGGHDLPGATGEAMGMLLHPRPKTRDEAIERALTAEQVLSGPKYRSEPERVRQQAELAYDRSFYPQGFGRQLVAILASGSRRERLAQVNIPTLVIHGDADPLVPVQGGIDIAKHVPGAKLHIIEGWGHTLPPTVWQELIDQISTHTR